MVFEPVRESGRDKDVPEGGTGSKPNRAKSVATPSEPPKRPPTSGKPATASPQKKPKKKLGRRLLIGGAIAAGTVVGGRFALHRAARPAAPSGPLSEEAKALIDAAWSGIDPKRVVDCHVHVVGLGIGDTGCTIHPRMRSLWHPTHYAKFEVYRLAAGIDDLERADQQYVARLSSLARQQLTIRRGDRAKPQPFLRLHILAFDRAHREDGSVDQDASEFYVPNDYVLQLAKQNPDVFLPCGSVHPYRKDAVAELERIAAAGIRCIKWLPSAMRIDPASEKCDAFYAKLAELKIPLLTHGGLEKAVEADDAQKLANPLRLRRALDAGVKTIVCHCASTGDDEDLDAPGDIKPRKPSVDLFLRLMDDPKYADRMYGDVSALVQFNRAEVLGRILERSDLHTRLINGSDYPLPAINVLVRTATLVKLGYIDETQRTLLNEIDRHNPLLFDFVLKRTLRGAGGVQFAPAVFMPPEHLFPG